MTDAERVYAEYVEPRSFACKPCGFLSTNRRVVEQHLRQSHAELFAGPPPPPSRPEPPVMNAERERLSPVANGAAAPAVLYTDAGTWDNGTKRQRSVLAVWDSRGQAIVVHEDLPGTTNNEAEYAAIIAALELARNDGLMGVTVRSDSQLCVNQINGAWKIKEERLRPLRDRAARLLNDVRGRIEWVPRERNHAGIFLEKTYKR